MASWYRDSLQIVKIIYDRAYDFLYKKLKEDGEEIRLPIDIRRVAEKCNFAISSEDLSDLEISDRFSPVAQLQMREKLSENQEIAGTILLANYLSETSARFSIAHELGHYVLREYSPIGLSYMMEACPGLYPLADTDELLAEADWVLRPVYGVDDYNHLSVRSAVRLFWTDCLARLEKSKASRD